VAAVRFFDDRLQFIIDASDAKPDSLRAYRMFKDKGQLRAFLNYAEKLAATGTNCIIQGRIAPRPDKAKQDFRFTCIM
jgi:hypothetical protein